jgi:hypothetical protein
MKAAAYRAPFSRWALVCAAAVEWWSYPATTEIQFEYSLSCPKGRERARGNVHPGDQS